MIHPIKSFNAYYQDWALKHFDRTKYSQQLNIFNNTHQGETCVIIGNGPSLQISDLEKIRELQIPSFAFNRIYLLFSDTNWRPTYYVSQDEKVLGIYKEDVNRLSLDNKFIPLYHKYYYDINIKKALYFNMKKSDNEYPLFSSDISKWIGSSNTVTYTAAQIAVYMGFTKIILLGIDHSFATYQNDRGEIMSDSSIRDYFSKEYLTNKSQFYIPNLDASTRAYISMKNYCGSKNIEVINATRGGRLEVFSRANFDSLF